MLNQLHRLIIVITVYLINFSLGNGSIRVGGKIPSSPPNHRSCLTDHERQTIMENSLHIDFENMRDTILFQQPVGNGGMMNGDKNYITNYVDENHAYGWLEDYTCYYITYDGHWGTDVAVSGFYYMDEMTTPILAAADGIVTYTHDGEFDRWTYWDNSAVSNTVALQHSDGTRSFYLHMKKNSVAVSVGDTVQVGDTLGFIGSSGFSDGPHLHFEVNTNNWNLIDPWEGDCGNTESWWADQLPHIGDSSAYPQSIFRYITSAYPAQDEDEFNNIVAENIPSLTHIRPGEDFMSLVAVRNLYAGDVLTWKWYKDGTLVDDYSFVPSETEWWYQGLPYYATSFWWVLNSFFSGDEQAGQWEEKVYINNTLHEERSFICTTEPNQTPSVVIGQYDVIQGESITGEFEINDDGDPFWFNLESEPFSGGTIDIFGGRNRKFTYTAPTEFVGSDIIGVSATDDRGVTGDISLITFNVIDDGLRNSNHPIPGEIRLYDAYPNPFNPTTTIRFNIPAETAHASSLHIYDLTGGVVDVILNNEIVSGEHEIQWDASHLPSGIYFYQFQTEHFSDTKKLILLK